MRDARLDLLRGFAMVTIVINHLSTSLLQMGLDGPEVPTPTRYGWSSAAELFVLMSGYMVGMVYLGKPNARPKLIGRAIKLFQTNIFMFVLVAPLALVSPSVMISTFRLDPLLTNPLKAIALFPISLYLPRLLDILQMYVIFMFASAAILPILNRRPWFIIILSAIVYSIAQVVHNFNVPPSPLDNRQPTFNPFAWQLLFFVSAVAGKEQIHHKVFAVAKRWRTLLPVIFLLLLIAGHIYANEHGLVPAMIGTRKPSLGPARIIHAGLLAIAYAGLIEWLGRYRSHWLVESVASIGRNSLNCFVLSVIGTYGSALAWWYSGSGWLGYIVALFVILNALRAGAWYWDTKKGSAIPVSQRCSMDPA